VAGCLLGADGQKVSGPGTEMTWNDEWSGLADFLANMIEKYAGEMDLDRWQGEKNDPFK